MGNRYTIGKLAKAANVNVETVRYYERLGLTEDTDYWIADAVAHEPQPIWRFWCKATQFQIRGDLAGIQAAIDKLGTAVGTEIDGLRRRDVAKYAAANIYVENFDVGIDVLENAFDLESLSNVNVLKTLEELESLHFLVYAYQQVGRGDEANVLLTQLNEQLKELIEQLKNAENDEEKAALEKRIKELEEKINEKE